MENQVQQSHYDISSFVEIIRDMGANEHFTLDNFKLMQYDSQSDRPAEQLYDLVITKDPDYDKNKNVITMDMDGKDVMNLVTVDIKYPHDSSFHQDPIVSTIPIPVNKLEESLNDILNGNASYFVNDSRPFAEIADDRNAAELAFLALDFKKEGKEWDDFEWKHAWKSKNVEGLEFVSGSDMAQLQTEIESDDKIEVFLDGDNIGEYSPTTNEAYIEGLRVAATSLEQFQTNIEMKMFLKQEISDYTYGTMVLDVSPSGYDDKLGEDTILTAYEDYNEGKASGYDKFSDYLKDVMYERIVVDNDWDYIEPKPMIEQIEKDIANKSDNFQEAYEQMKDEYGSELDLLYDVGFRGVDLDCEGFLEKDYKFNLLFATPNELNLDMGSIPDLWGGDMDYYALTEETVDNALTYIIHQQGHTLSEVLQGEKNAFIESVAAEIDNYPYYSMGGVTACVAMSGQDMLDVLDTIASKEGNIELSKETTIGIFDNWNGAGSVLEIKPEKPVIIPASMVKTLQLEGAGRDINRGYTVDQTYGLIGSCWTDGSIKTTSEKPVLREERFEDIKKAFIEKFEEKPKEKSGIELD